MADFSITIGAVNSAVNATDQRAGDIVTNWLKSHNDLDPTVDIDALSNQEKADMFIQRVGFEVKRRANLYAENQIRADKESEIAADLAALDLAWTP